MASIRKKYPPTFKAKVVLEAIREEKATWSIEKGMANQWTERDSVKNKASPRRT